MSSDVACISNCQEVIGETQQITMPPWCGRTMEFLLVERGHLPLVLLKCATLVLKDLGIYTVALIANDIY